MQFIAVINLPKINDKFRIIENFTSLDKKSLILDLLLLELAIDIAIEIPVTKFGVIGNVFTMGSLIFAPHYSAVATFGILITF